MSRLIVLFAMLTVAGGTVAALPIKPKLADIIKEVKKPQVNYPPARAGWNGPEEKSAALRPNAAYDQMRYAMSAEAARSQLIQVAKPDWRALLIVASIIFFWRYKLDRSAQRKRQGQSQDNGEVVTIPNSPASQDRAA